MARRSPLRTLDADAGATFMLYGPEGSPDAVELVESFGALELEYAAIRKSCAIVDQPHRGVIEVRGPDRVDFLNRMVTQEMKGLGAGEVRRSFWLNRKGRIDADLRVIHSAERTWLECDIHAAARTLEGLSSYVITEDVTLRDISEEIHRLALHGPTGLSLLRESVGPGFTLDAGRAEEITIAGVTVVVFREDSTGGPGYELMVSGERGNGDRSVQARTIAVYRALIERGADPNRGSAAALGTAALTPGSGIRVRPIGWHAYNIARVEAGTPLYFVDFGPDSLPAETGVIADRVSFTKGCYLGQEIVARMHSRGHPKRALVALTLARQVDVTTGVARQPSTGAAVLRGTATESEPGDPIGAVTSSITSPMLGSTPVCFAQVRHEFTPPGTSVQVVADGVLLAGTVHPSLGVWSPGTARAARPE